MTISSIRGFIKMIRPWYLLGGILLYSLGAGIARFLGNTIDWRAYFLGQAVVILLQLSPIFLREYFDSQKIPGVPRKPVPDDPLAGEDEFHLGRLSALFSTATVLSAGAVLTAIMYQEGFLRLETITILGIAFLIVFFYVTPPVRLVHSGYGELATAILMSNLIPALAFLLQVGTFHQLLAMTTFPLTPIYLAMLLASSLSTYASDMKYDKRTLLVRIGWERGMSLHNLLVLTGFLLIGIGMLFGLSWHISWPTLLALPLGLYQIWQIIQIRDGGKPRWRVLNVTAAATFGLIAYLLTFTFWIS